MWLTLSVFLKRVNNPKGYNKGSMKLEEKIKNYTDYFESIGMTVNYADTVISHKIDNDGIVRNVETNALRFEVEYKNCFYNFANKSWHDDTCALTVYILPNGLWSIWSSGMDDSVNLGYFTGDVAKSTLETLVKKCKTL